MTPMLAWIANSALRNLKATFFAIMASFINLALWLSNHGTKYLNQIYVITREVKNPLSNEIQVAADYSLSGYLIWVTIIFGLVLPIGAIFVVRYSRLRWA